MTLDPNEYRPDDRGEPNEDPPEYRPEDEQRDELEAAGAYDDDPDQSLHQAIGWLRTSLEVDHPGYLAEQIRRAERAGYLATAAGLRYLAGTP